MDTAKSGTPAEVTFDGHYYRYGPYRYDRREDAVAYADLERAQGRAPRPALRPIEPATDPSGDAPAAEALGVTFEGKRFHFDDYHYDRCEDALAFARLQRIRRLHD